MPLAPENLTDAGQLVGFGLHDSVLVSLSLEFQHALTASFRRVDGSLIRLSLGGLGPTGAVGLRDNAILSDVFAWPPAEVPSASLERPDGAWGVLFAGDLPASDLERAGAPLIAGRQFQWIVLIECSYGGSLAALCKEIEVVEGSTTLTPVTDVR